MSDVNKQLLEVASELVKFQEIYEKNTSEIGRMPGNDLYGPMLMRIVDCAKEAIAATEAAQLVYISPELEHMAEEAECVAMCLNDRNVPTRENGKSLSLWGRVELYAQPPAVADRDAIRRVFMAHGFTIKDGKTDLKPYVYEAAEALLRELSPAVAVPDGYALVPIEPTPEMLVAINWPNDSSGYRAMIAAAPKP